MAGVVGRRGRRLRHTGMTAAAIIAAVAPTALAMAPSGAEARALRPISGRLSPRGYTVIVLGYNGKVAVSTRRNFRIPAPDSRVTVQLRDRHGKYAGPVIVGGGGSRVLEGVKAGARLGAIRILSGYARTARPIAGRYVDRGRWAQATAGVPIGNGRNFGLVRSTVHSGPSGPGGDTSRTGVPNSLSIDPAGDGAIDALASSARVKGPMARIASAAQAPALYSTLYLFPDSTVNADASNVTSADIDAALRAHLNVLAENVPAGKQVALDCGGLSYCSAGGTGRLWDKDTDTYYRFPSCCDPSHDGFGELRGSKAVGLGMFGMGGPDSWGLLFPGATSSQIGSGDAYVVRVSSGSGVSEIPTTLPYVFNTVPAIESYDDGAGDAVTVTYPYHCTEPGLGDGCGAGSQSQPFPVSTNASGHVVLTLHVWRPQRKGIAGAGESTWMDVGHLYYSIIGLPLASMNGAPHDHAQACSAASLSTTDPNLTVVDTGAQPAGDFAGTGNDSGAILDSSPDQPSNTNNLLSLTVDLTKCITDLGGTGFDNHSGPIGLVAWTGDGTGYAYQGSIWVARGPNGPAPAPGK